MKLREEAVTAHPVADVYAAEIEPSVREDACRRSGALSWTVTVTPSGDGARVEVERVMPAQVPDLVKSFVGDTITIRQTEEWSGPANDGARNASINLTVVGQPASMKGTISLRPDGSSCVEVVEGDVSVNVPFLGRKIEPEIVKVIAAGVRIEQQTRADWLAQR